MTQLVRRLEDLPTGSHSLSFYGSESEAARNMASFLKGAEEFGQEALVLTSSDKMLDLYRGELAKRGPDLATAIRRIPGPHIRPTAGGFRPVTEVMEFVAAHKVGATVCGDTIPSILDRRSLPAILDYEDWFDSLRPFEHRGLCPYDLSRLPVDRAPEALRRLVRAHTHAVLSDSPNPGVRFLQLLVLPHVENPPEEHLRSLAHAVDYGLIDQRTNGAPADLTPRGKDLARALLGLPGYVQSARAAVSGSAGA